MLVAASVCCCGLIKAIRMIENRIHGTSLSVLEIAKYQLAPSSEQCLIGFLTPYLHHSYRESIKPLD